ncbi:MAG: DUF3575 domain-containing protein [Bacteroidaceae bacterium]
MIRTLKIICFIVLTLVGAQRVCAQQVAIKTNVLMLGMLTPNLSCEIVTGERTSLDLSVFGHHKPYGINSKMLSFQPEFKYWFNGRPMIREYVGIAALGSTYDIIWKRDVFKGDAVGLGVTGGYSFALNKRFCLELTAGFGVVYFRQKQYYINDNFDDFYVNGIGKPNVQGYKLLPIKIGVTLSYIIK